MKHHAGILDDAPEWDRVQVLILAHTPGVPLEWIYAALDLKKVRRRQVRDMIDAVRQSGSTEWAEMGLENAGSVSHADGWKMLEVVCPRYSGPAPLMSQMALRNDTRSNAAIAAVLGVHREKVRRWRVNRVFCPLTGVRLLPNRGVSLLC